MWFWCYSKYHGIHKTLSHVKGTRPKPSYNSLAQGVEPTCPKNAPKFGPKIVEKIRPFCKIKVHSTLILRTGESVCYLCAYSPFLYEMLLRVQEILSNFHIILTL